MFYTKAKLTGNGEKKARFIASTDRNDHHGDTIDVNGWDLSVYKANPVVLFGHDQHALPVGRSESIGVKGGELITDIDFTAAAEIDPFADKVARMVDAKLLNAVSVSFNPTEFEPRYDEDGYFTGYHFKQQILTEISIVPVPANADALRVAKSLQLKRQDLNRLFITPDKKAVGNVHALKLRLLKACARA